MHQSCNIRSDSPHGLPNYTTDPKQFFKHKVRLWRPNYMKETDPRACNINAVGYAMVQKNFAWWCHGPAPQQANSGQRPALADTWWTKGKADTWQTRFGDTAKVDTRPDTRRTQGGHGGHMAATWRAKGGQAPGTRAEHIAASLFFLRENPTVNCLGKNQAWKATYASNKSTANRNQ